jgi:hypothetical protein
MENYRQPFQGVQLGESPNASRPKAYPPKGGVGKRATKENARTASLAVVMTGAATGFQKQCYTADERHAGLTQDVHHKPIIHKGL